MDASNMEDLRLPNTVVARLIKEAIPSGVNVSKEARTAIARSAAIFIVHATAYANEYAVAQGRKNITAADIFHAIKALECDELEAPMTEAMKFFKVQHEQRKKRKNAANAARRANGRAADAAAKINGGEPDDGEEEEAEPQNGHANEEDDGEEADGQSSDGEGENEAPDGNESDGE